MRQSCWIACSLLTAVGVLMPFAGAEADEQAAGKQALGAWRAWQEMHPLPLPENEESEERLLRELFTRHSFADACDALLEREVVPLFYDSYVYAWSENVTDVEIDLTPINITKVKVKP